jgi:FPC/CPF motif-containing protein YcgG
MASRGERSRGAVPIGADGGIHASRDIPGHALPAWQLEAFHEIRSHVADDAFPCIFARRSFNLDAWYFVFVESFDTPGGRAAVAEAVATYLQRLDPDPEKPVLMPLLVVEQPIRPALTLDDYHRRGWSLLQSMHDGDPDAWPDDVPVDTDDNEWGFCFRGQPLFINFSSPAHSYFRSRNLGASMVLVLQRATNFDAVTSYDWNGPKGHAVRKVIRDRVDKYEGHPAPVEFTIAGTPAERAWKQMAIPEPDGQYPAQCPFHARKRG